MTPGTKRQAWKSLTRFPTSAAPTTTTDLSLEIPARFAGENMRWQKRSIPALSRTCTRKMPLKAALLKRTRAQRIPFRPGVRYSNQGRIHSRRPILSSSLFACKTAADHTFRVDGDRLGGERIERKYPLTLLFGTTEVEMFQCGDHQHSDERKRDFE